MTSLMSCTLCDLPVIRVMVEGDDEQEVNALAQHLADSVRSQAQVA
jgi:phosphoglucosamine mutase